MSKFDASTFGSGKVQIDGNTFFKCLFDGTTLEYAGGDEPLFIECTFRNVDIAFAGPAANTLSFMAGLFRSGFRPIIEATIAQMTEEPTVSKDDNNG